MYVFLDLVADAYFRNQGAGTSKGIMRIESITSKSHRDSHICGLSIARSACVMATPALAAYSCDPNALSNFMLEHMLDCSACLEGALDGNHVECATYHELYERLAGLGGATAPMVFAY